MKLILFVMLCAALAGCDDGFIQTPREEWQTAPAEYSCTVEQMKLVESQAAWCDENTSFFSSYCYGTAFIRNCTKEQTK